MGLRARERLAGDFRCPDGIDCAGCRRAACFGEDGEGIEVGFGKSRQRDIFAGNFGESVMAFRGVSAAGKRQRAFADFTEALVDRVRRHARASL